ncbi:hypothetical protein B0H14DRAFT_2998768 [Mycena olivaceomarginata]|nr:hypothetical protein B0H14DRAFT_2998768 [Mycena olivaceomarginata]
MPIYNAGGSETFESLWVDAFDVYKHRTTIDLRDKTAILPYKTVTDFGGYREGSPKWHKFRQRLKPVITAVTVFIDAAAEGAASKSVPGGKMSAANFDALIDLFETLGSFLRQLKIRSDVPFGNESKIVVVEILHFVRELFKADDMKAILDRLNKLTTIESRMTITEMLYAAALLGQIEQATSSIRSQHIDLMARLSKLPDAWSERESMQRISERSPSITEPRTPENALVIQLDYTHIEGSAYALSGLQPPSIQLLPSGLYTQTIILYIAAYMTWRLIVQITRSITSAPGIDTKPTIVVIDILGLEFRLPLDRCATFEDFHNLIAERASKQEHKSAAKYVLSRAYEVADRNNSAVIYPHIWARKVRAGMKLEMAVLLRRRSLACPWCGQENTQALWIHCDCGQAFEVSAASQMGPRDTPRERSTAFIEELQPESSQRTSLPTTFESSPDDADELPSFRKVHVIFDDSKDKRQARGRGRRRMMRLSVYYYSLLDAAANPSCHQCVHDVESRVGARWAGTHGPVFSQWAHGVKPQHPTALPLTVFGVSFTEILDFRDCLGKTRVNAFSTTPMNKISLPRHISLFSRHAHLSLPSFSHNVYVIRAFYSQTNRPHHSSTQYLLVRSVTQLRLNNYRAHLAYAY